MESGTFDHLVDGILRNVQRQAHEIEAIAGHVGDDGPIGRVMTGTESCPLPSR